MSENSAPIDDVRLEKDKSWLGFFLKFLFFVSAFVIVIITILANMGGNNETLKSGLTDFASRTFGGLPVTVDRLVNMRFFPSIGVDIEGLHVQPYAGAPENLLTIEKLKFFSDFWQIMAGTQKFKLIYVSGLQAKQGFMGDRAFSAETIHVNHDISEGKASLRGNGKLGVYDWSFDYDLGVSGYTGSYNFFFENDRKFNAQIADITMAGRATYHGDNFLTLENVTIGNKKRQFVGNLKVSVLGEYMLAIKGDLNANNDHGTISFDVSLERDAIGRAQINGTVNGKNLTREALDGENSIIAFIGRMSEVLSFNDIQMPIKHPFDMIRSYSLDLTLALENFQTEKHDDNILKFHILNTPRFAHVSDISGILDGLDVAVPDLYVMREPNAKQETSMRALLAGEKLNPHFASYVAHQLPAAFTASSALDGVSCGLVHVHGEKGADALILETAEGKKTFGAAQDDKILLTHADYEYISTSLKAKRTDHPCLPFIAIDPQEAEKKKQEDLKAKAMQDAAAMSNPAPTQTQESGAQ